jgi:hypothetical protein
MLCRHTQPQSNNRPRRSPAQHRRGRFSGGPQEQGGQGSFLCPAILDGSPPSPAISLFLLSRGHRSHNRRWPLFGRASWPENSSWARWQGCWRVHSRARARGINPVPAARRRSSSAYFRSIVSWPTLRGNPESGLAENPTSPAMRRRQRCAVEPPIRQHRWHGRGLQTSSPPGVQSRGRS